MGVLFQVGDPSQFPPKPRGFPTCGDWQEPEDLSSRDRHFDLINHVIPGAHARDSAVSLIVGTHKTYSIVVVNIIFFVFRIS